MRHYLLQNSEEQHQERLALVRYYSERRGRPVHYSEILHELQHERFVALGLAPTGE